MDTPLYDKVNATQASDVAWGAYLGIAMIGADISDNSCTGGGCEEEPTGTDAGEPPPLVVGGTNRQLFVARDVRVSGNTGFQGSPAGYYSTRPQRPAEQHCNKAPGHTIGDPWPGAGWLRLLGDDRQPWMARRSTAVTTSAPATSPIRGCMNYHTWTADRVRVRNLIKRPDWQHPTAADAGGTVPSISTANVTIDGDVVVEWSQTAGAASVLLGQLDLAANPSVANHSVFLALDTRLIFNGTLELLIDGGDGVWHSSGTGTERGEAYTSPASHMHRRKSGECQQTEYMNSFPAIVAGLPVAVVELQHSVWPRLGGHDPRPLPPFAHARPHDELCTENDQHTFGACSAQPGKPNRGAP